MTAEDYVHEDNLKYSDIYSKLTTQRVIFLSEDITKEIGSFISALLLYFDHEDHEKEITIYINSNGGDVAALSNIYDIMQMISAPIRTICIGKAYSAAAVLLAAGTKGLRLATRHSDIMIHGIQTESNANMNKIDAEIDFKMFETYNKLVMQILSRHTKKKIERITVDCARDLYMDPKQALDYGIIDFIV